MHPGDQQGSSPLARGTPPGATDQGRSHQVHPRSRGEHAVFRHSPVWSVGSSPLARGTQANGAGPGRGQRFIPARAGNTPLVWSEISTSTVHPRSRGEHSSGDAGAALRLGSSPLARGTRRLALRRRPARRFIPARAGNTRWVPATRSPSPVHPRSRGEHDGTTLADFRRDGSSPLARGTHRDVDLDGLDGRFIPARAGNTAISIRAAVVSPVHPRSRGEHSSAVIVWPTTAGSSPLARGTPRPRRRAAPERRFIPARAGNTSSPAPATSRPPVHPRSRGEHHAQLPFAEQIDGSSPLARGTRGKRAAPRKVGRFIPARAGNTSTT